MQLGHATLMIGIDFGTTNSAVAMADESGMYRQKLTWKLFVRSSFLFLRETVAAAYRHESELRKDELLLIGDFVGGNRFHCHPCWPGGAQNCSF
jgi:molecular chaperone DnaK (HSP70)